MGGRVVMYQLTAKLVDSATDVPRDAEDVIYYTLSVGHHTGVMDCFSPRLSCSVETFESVLGGLPAGAARSKLEGILRFGEIQIDKSHLLMIRLPLERALKDLYVKRDANPYSAEISWINGFIQLLDSVASKAAVYLVGRRVDD